MSSIERIEKLIALSGSANEHEARSAAYLACKMIREGAYRVIEPASSASASASASRPWADPWADHFAGTPWGAPPPPARRDPPPRRPRPDTRPRRHVACEVARAKRSGLCALCGEEFAYGSDVAFPALESDVKLGAVHADCRAGWTVPVED